MHAQTAILRIWQEARDYTSASGATLKGDIDKYITRIGPKVNSVHIEWVVLYK